MFVVRIGIVMAFFFARRLRAATEQVGHEIRRSDYVWTIQIVVFTDADAIVVAASSNAAIACIVRTVPYCCRQSTAGLSRSPSIVRSLPVTTSRSTLCHCEVDATIFPIVSFLLPIS
jgi:hypothetical protein